MYDNEFFVVDMASCSSTGEIINSLSLALETLNHSGKKIVLKLNDSYFNQSQMLSIQSLITSYGCILDTVETTNEDTIKVVENMNIPVQKPIEKRLDNNYSNINSTNSFEPFSMSSQNNIEQKEENLHFEADLDAFRKQNEVDIPSFNNVQDSKDEDFTIMQNHFTAHHDDIIEPETVISDEFQDADDLHTAALYAQNLNTINKEQESKEENTEEFENTEKKSIGVYKKAYDENAIDQDEWEEVDFYETPSNDPVVSDSKHTTYINQTLRSGQVIESDGNVVIIGDCHPGSEIRAIGDITVWGILSGIAHAGYKGNNSAKVRALKMNAVQLRIGDCYSRRPDGTNIPYIIKSSIFTPEEARVVDGEIMLFKINQKN